MKGTLMRRLWRQRLFAAALLTAVALSGPALTLERASYRYIVVFDITQSMNVADAPDGATRLDAATRAVGDALAALPCGAEAGLALFSGHRVFLLFSPVEICANSGELAAMLDAVDWSMAWEASSEIAKGLHKSVDLIADLDGDARLVFLSDGHEAPPVHPDYRHRFRGEPGVVKGLVVGVGGPTLRPIPKFDSKGKPIGYWQADEVLQTDTYSAGRGGTSVREAMVDSDRNVLPDARPVGTEHLSSLREGYLRELAAETGLGYLRLTDAGALAARLRDGGLAHYRPRPTDLSWLPALLALLLLLSYCLPSVRWRGAARAVSMG